MPVNSFRRSLLIAFLSTFLRGLFRALRCTRRKLQFSLPQV